MDTSYVVHDYEAWSAPWGRPERTLPQRIHGARRIAAPAGTRPEIVAARTERDYCTILHALSEFL